MEHETEWGQAWTATIGRRMLAVRNRRGMKTPQLAQRCRELGYPISRSQITKLEIGDRRTVTVQEVAVLARALDVPPAALLYPVNDDTQPVDVLPGVEVRPSVAVEWFTGRVMLDESFRAHKMTAQQDDSSLSWAVTLSWREREAERLLAELEVARRDLEAVDGDEVQQDSRTRAVEKLEGDLSNTVRELRWERDWAERVGNMTLAPLSPRVAAAVVEYGG